MANIVKSVEFIEYTMGSTDISGSVSLTKGQNYLDCVPFMTSSSSSDYLDSKLIDMTLTADTITFERSTQRSNAVYIKCYVVEFDSTKVRVQQGTFNVTSSSTHTVTLPTTLNATNKAAISFGWKCASASLSFYQHVVRGRVTATTTIDFYRNSVSGNCTGHWFLFEDLNNNFNVTHLSSSFDVGSQTNTINNGRCVDPLRTFFIGSYASASSGAYSSRSTTRILMYSDGTAYLDKGDASFNTIYWSCQVIEFLDLTKVYIPFRLHGPGFSATTYSKKVGDEANSFPFSCDLDYSMASSTMVQGLSRVDSSLSASFRETFVSVKLSDSNTFSFSKDSASYTAYQSHTVAVAWNGVAVDIGTNSSPIPEGNGVGQSFVKSVENFRFTTGEISGARILTKGQTWENCAIFSSVKGSGGDTFAVNLVNVYLVSPGIVCFKVWAGGGGQTIDVSVVEFWPNQIKVQHKNFYNSYAGTATTSIDTVSNINKCFIVSKCFSPSGSTTSNMSMVRVDFANTSTIRTYINNASYPIDTSFFVVEDLQDNFDTRHFSSTWAAVGNSVYDEQFNWEAENTFIIASYASAGTSVYPSRGATRSYYAYEHRPCYSHKYDVSFHDIYMYLTVVKFKHKDKHIQHINYTFSSVSYVGTYSSYFAEHSDALTCFNTSQQSTMACNTSLVDGISDSFGTIRITDYGTRTYELSKAAHGYTSDGAFIMIDWIGTHHQLESGITSAVPTRSLVVSIQNYSYTGTSGFLSIPLNTGQNMKQCVPFISSSVAASDNNPIRFYRSIFRHEDPDRFIVRFGAGATATREVMTIIVEFGDDIKIQYGSGYSTGTTKSFTIEAVNLSRAFLVFYSFCDSWETSLRSYAICGHFTNTTTLEFIRTTAVGCMYISWYVVECPDDDSYWKVQHVYETNKGGAGTINVTIPYYVSHERALLLASWNTTNTDVYPSKSMYRMYHTINSVVEFSKLDASFHDMNNVNVEVVEMSAELLKKGFRAKGNYITLAGATTIGNSSLQQNSGTFFDLNRSMVISGNQNDGGRSETSLIDGRKEGFHFYTFSSGNTIVALKSEGANYTTYSYYYAYQWPAYKTHYIDGYVKEQNIAVERTVRAYRADTGEEMDETTSVSGTGYFYLDTTYSGAHYVVCLDDVDGISYNDLIYGKIYPTVISGSFAYKYGLVNYTNSDKGYAIGGWLGISAASIEALTFNTETCVPIMACMSSARYGASGVNSSTKGYTAGGYSTTYFTTIDALTFDGETNSAISATLNTAKYYCGGVNSTTKGYFMGGTYGTAVAVIEDLTFAVESSEVIVATLSGINCAAASISSSTKGYTLGGYDMTTNCATIEDLTFSTELSVRISATLGTARRHGTGVNSSTKGYVMGGYTTAGVATIDSLTFITETTEVLSDSLDVTKYSGAGVNNLTKGYSMGGHTGTVRTTVIDDLVFSTEISVPILATLYLAKWVTPGVQSGGYL